MAVKPDDIPDIVAERINTAAAGVVARTDSYVGHQSKRDRRIDELTSIVGNIFSTYYPDGRVSDDAPKIGNAIARDLEDVGKTVGNPVPTVMAKAASESDPALKEAQKRTQLLAAIRDKNKLRLLRSKLAMDLAGTGLAVLAVYPDLAHLKPDGKEDLEKKKKSLPRIYRKSPRLSYPDPSYFEGDDLRNLLVHQKRFVRDIADVFRPAVRSLFTQHEAKEADSKEVTIDEWYDSEQTMLVASFKKNGEQRARVTVLAHLPNLCGVPMVVLAQRPTFDGQFRGQFDEAIEPLVAANAIFQMSMDNIADEVYAPLAIIGQWDNDADFGPGARPRTTDTQARLERVPPVQSSGQIWAKMDWLQSQSRISSGRSEVRSGALQNLPSIVSGSGLQGLQGMDITNVETYQILNADLESRAYALALAVDEKYLDVEGKTVDGFIGGAYFALTYRPSRLINGNYSNIVVYGEGSGLDRFNQTQLILQLVTGGLRSKRWARQQLPGEVDVLADEAQIIQELAEVGILGELTGERMSVIEKYKVALAASENKSVLELVPELLSIQEQAAIPEPEAPLAIDQQARALARGGQPGRAERLRGAPLPSVGELQP